MSALTAALQRAAVHANQARAAYRCAIAIAEEVLR
jgi:hypothetical protein